MNTQLEKLQLAYEYLHTKLAEIPRGELLVVEKYNFGCLVTVQQPQYASDSRVFPTIPFLKFHQYVLMKHYQHDIIHIEGHVSSYFYVKTLKHR